MWCADQCVLTCPGWPPCPAHFVLSPSFNSRTGLKTTFVLHCLRQAETRRGERHRNCLNISRLDLIFRFFLFDKESLCTNRNTHMHKYTVYIFIYNNNKKKNSWKKGTFSWGRKRAGAQAPLDVYVCTWRACIFQSFWVRNDKEAASCNTK